MLDQSRIAVGAVDHAHRNAPRAEGRRIFSCFAGGDDGLNPDRHDRAPRKSAGDLQTSPLYPYGDGAGHSGRKACSSIEAQFGPRSKTVGGPIRPGSQRTIRSRLTREAGPFDADRLASISRMAWIKMAGGPGGANHVWSAAPRQYGKRLSQTTNGWRRLAPGSRHGTPGFGSTASHIRVSIRAKVATFTAHLCTTGSGRANGW